MRYLSNLIVLAVVATGASASERLDHNAMRLDLFAVLGGDKAAADRLITMTSKVLDKEADHPQALAWHGAILITTGIMELSSTDDVEAQAARKRFGQGITEIDRAITLDPDNPEFRSVRGALMLPLSRQLPAPLSTRMLERAREDFQRIFDLQKDQLDLIGRHPLGELLQALGDVYSRQSNPAEAEKYYQLTKTKLAGTEYARRAALWLETKQPLPQEMTDCVGCHVSGN